MSDAPRKLDILSVDPDTNARMRVRAATSAHLTFGKFHQSSSLEDASRRMGGSENVDIVFITERVSEGLTEFVKASKQTLSGQDAAYVMIIQSSDDLQAKIAQHMVSGIDSFLQEPFSADAINEIAQLAFRIKLERVEAREFGAIKFLMTQISDKISAIAQLKAAGMDGRRELRKLAEMCQIFSSLDDEKRTKYHQAALDVFEAARVPPPLPPMQYKGALANASAFEFSTWTKRTDVVRWEKVPKA